MWLCRLIGHRHVRYSLCEAQFNLNYCLRCHANVLTQKGDGCAMCEVFGHKTQKTLVGDYDSQTTKLYGAEGANGCFRCHAIAGGGVMTSGT